MVVPVSYTHLDVYKRQVSDGKQCAVLCPTTILAWQHYQTFLKRFDSFPVNIEVLSRFRTPKQQKEIVKKLARGQIDIIIGTHRIVQKDVEFKDLGLAVIDAVSYTHLDVYKRQLLHFVKRPLNLAERLGSMQHLLNIRIGHLFALANQSVLHEWLPLSKPTKRTCSFLL